MKRTTLDCISHEASTKQRPSIHQGMMCDCHRHRSPPEMQYRRSPPYDKDYRHVSSPPDHCRVSPSSPLMEYQKNDIENIEIENYSLRNRCKRLEAIVSQLIESKEKDTIEPTELIANETRKYNNLTDHSIRSLHNDDAVERNIYARQLSGSTESPSPIYHDIQMPVTTLSPESHRKLSPLEILVGTDINKNIIKTENITPPERIDNKRNSCSSLSNSAEMEKQNEFFRNTYYQKGRSKSNKTEINRGRNERHSFKPYIGRTNSDSPYRRTYGSKYMDELTMMRNENEADSKRYGIPYKDITQHTCLSTKQTNFKNHYNSNSVMSNFSTSSNLSNISPPSKFVESKLHRNEPKFNQFSSDFYTKLPPKLHIVESQNKNGVTLTWNATSNCDSSLVESYQLFARELFGYKVGTMKRIGIIPATPLPMSCKVEKLKFNIKYKFAVCAVDVYGRFGKMSNFTGKFELKSENNDDGDDTDSDELIIIVK